MVLPAKAVNARMGGVMPARGKGDWGREEEDWLGRRVEGGMFVAQVGESWEAGGDLGLGLVMHDTSKEEDIHSVGNTMSWCCRRRWCRWPCTFFFFFIP